MDAPPSFSVERVAPTRASVQIARFAFSRKKANNTIFQK
jgi:hypothetical protein